MELRVAKELRAPNPARFNGLTDAGKGDLQEDIFGRSKPDVVSALEKFGHVGDATRPRPVGGWKMTNVGFLKVALNSTCGTPVPEENSPKMPRECVRAVVSWWQQHFPDDVVTDFSTSNMWSAIEGWRSCVHPVTGELTEAEIARRASERSEPSLEQQEDRRRRLDLGDTLRTNDNPWSGGGILGAGGLGTRPALHFGAGTAAGQRLAFGGSAPGTASGGGSEMESQEAALRAAVTAREEVLRVEEIRRDEEHRRLRAEREAAEESAATNAGFGAAGGAAENGGGASELSGERLDAALRDLLAGVPGSGVATSSIAVPQTYFPQPLQRGVKRKAPTLQGPCGPDLQGPDNGREESDEVQHVPTDRAFRSSTASRQDLLQAQVEFASDVWERKSSCLTTPGGWANTVNWKLVHERIASHARQEFIGMHFYTAVAICVDAEDAVREVKDTSGLTTLARTVGQEMFASEYLDHRWQQGVNRLTRGATVESVNLSDGVLRALAGNAGVNPAPELVAALFGQLFAAGTNVQGALPFGQNQVRQGAAAPKAVIRMSPSERAAMIQAQERIVAVGTPPEVLDLVSSSISNIAGASLPEKLAAYRKSVNKSLSSSKSVTTIGPSGDGSSLTVEMADGTAAFHVAMQIRCIFGCVMTAGHADYLSTDLDVTKKVYRAISARAFSSSEFSFVALIPDIINRPSLAAMKISMKELEDGRMIGSSTYYQSAADDALHYPWLRWGLLTFVAVEGPNFDGRFLTKMVMFAEGILRWAAVGVPMAQVVRAIAKCLTLAERNATQVAASIGREGSAPTNFDGGFITDQQLEDMVVALNRYSRADQMAAANLWKRQAELAGVSTMIAAGGPGSKKPTADTDTQRAVDKAVSEALKRERNNNCESDGRRNRNRRGGGRGGRNGTG